LYCGKVRIQGHEVHQCFNKCEHCTERQKPALNQPGIFFTCPNNGPFELGDENYEHRTDMNSAPPLTSAAQVESQETSRPPTRRRGAILVADEQASTIRNGLNTAETGEAHENENANARPDASEILNSPAPNPPMDALLRPPLDFAILPTIPLPQEESLSNTRLLSEVSSALFRQANYNSAARRRPLPIYIPLVHSIHGSIQGIAPVSSEFVGDSDNETGSRSPQRWRRCPHSPGSESESPEESPIENMILFVNAMSQK
jgi:hypothetical protein